MSQAPQQEADESAPLADAARWTGSVEFLPSVQRPTGQPRPNIKIFADDNNAYGSDLDEKAAANESPDDGSEDEEESTPRASEKPKSLLFGSAPIFHPSGGGVMGSGVGNSQAPTSTIQDVAFAPGHPGVSGGIDHPEFGTGPGGMFPLGFGNVSDPMNMPTFGNGNRGNVGMVHNMGTGLSVGAMRQQGIMNPHNVMDLESILNPQSVMNQQGAMNTQGTMSLRDAMRQHAMNHMSRQSAMNIQNIMNPQTGMYPRAGVHLPPSGNAPGLGHFPSPNNVPGYNATQGTNGAPNPTNTTGSDDPSKPPRSAEMHVACAKICRLIALEKIGPWEPTPENHQCVSEMLIYVGNYLLQDQFYPGPMAPLMGMYVQNPASGQAMNQMSSALVAHPQFGGGNGNMESSSMATWNANMANVKANIMGNSNTNTMANPNMMANPNVMANPNAHMMANQHGMPMHNQRASMPDLHGGMSEAMFRHQNGMPQMDPNGAHNAMAPRNGAQGYMMGSSGSMPTLNQPADLAPDHPYRSHGPARQATRFLNNAMRHNRSALGAQKMGPDNNHRPARPDDLKLRPDKREKRVAPRNEEEEHRRMMDLMQHFGGDD